jgi:DNA repair protein RadD
MQLRDYQQRAVDQLYDWFHKGYTGNPCIVMPTGSGKSHVVAALCKDALQNWPETRVLMLTHVKELIEQNAEKMRQHWLNAPMGIYSAGIGMKQLGEPITFAGIQSIRSRAGDVGHVDLVLIDECHLVNHEEEGGYRTLLAELKNINPNLRVIGLTATPYRLGHGMITDKPAIFDGLIEPVSIEELVHRGYLAPLRSKLTKTKLDVSGVHKRGGEYIESELQAAVDTKFHNEAVVSEVISRAGKRKAWLFFCAGVDHANNIAKLLQEKGVVAACITGETPKAERERILDDFKAGKITAITNANVLTTGFDYPDIDLIAMLRPTMSPGLYVQMAGRGMRPKSHTDHCMVLDFAGVVEKHGPITAVNPPTKGREGDGAAPMKACEECHELNPISARVCSCCGAPFPVATKAPVKLHNLDIMGIDGSDMMITDWKWRKHISRTSGKEMIAVTYYGALSDPSVTEYFPITHDGYAGEKARKELFKIAKNADVDNETVFRSDDIEAIAILLNFGDPPDEIEYIKDGKFFRVMKRVWAA